MKRIPFRTRGSLLLSADLEIPLVCGRYALIDNPVNHQEITNLSFLGELELPGLLPRYNIGPTQSMPVIGVTGDRSWIERMRWGLVPAWARDSSGAARMINARAETVTEKPAFRSAFQRRRCLVPASGYFEWSTTPTGKQPHWIHRQDRDLLWLAGLWEEWKGPEGPLRTYTILTKAADGIAARVHSRMPAILTGETLDAWLDPATDVEHLLGLLQPNAHAELGAYPVTRAVNHIGYDQPEALLPFEEEEPVSPQLSLW